ncbi:MAG: hypothetical protein A2X36_09455 [Elusimicrobia bacterium GWA2_69_24]|nr:MAG: hypothetical protein A2X36_09455 [Elusimicrobia bacterium GWA2_69_24]
MVEPPLGDCKEFRAAAQLLLLPAAGWELFRPSIVHEGRGSQPEKRSARAAPHRRRTMANIGFAVNNRRKNQETGAWEEVPVWVELKAFTRGSGRKLADLAEQHLRKGQLIYVEGRLVLDQWTGKEDGKKHSRTLVHVEDIQFLEGRRAKADPRGRPEDPPVS